MMNTRESLSQLDTTIGYYLEQLQGVSEEQLTRQPAEDKWSIGQLYVHLIQATQFMSLRNIGLCQEGNSESITVGGMKSDTGVGVFQLGRFPDIKIHVPPSPQYSPMQPNNKEELAQGLHKIVERMKAVEPTLAGIPPEHSAPHPNLGDLNATEWFSMVEMHFRHHLKQLGSLQQFLSQEAVS
jgi:hypothetical protein